MSTPITRAIEALELSVRIFQQQNFDLEKGLVLNVVNTLTELRALKPWPSKEEFREWCADNVSVVDVYADKIYYYLSKFHAPELSESDREFLEDCKKWLAPGEHLLKQADYDNDKIKIFMAAAERLIALAERNAK